MNKYYVYALLDPSKNDQIFYIGKGSNDRVKNHYAPYNLKENTRKCNTIKSYRNEGYNDKFVILQYNLSLSASLFLEESLINKYGRLIDNSGILTNVSIGGDNPPVHKGNDNPAVKAVKSGTFWNKGKNSVAKKASIAGKYWSDKISEGQRKLVSENKHHFQGKSNPSHARVLANTHNFQNILPWNNVNSTKSSINTWFYSDRIYFIWKNDTSVGQRKLFKLAKSVINNNISANSIYSIMIKFRNGWNPLEDNNWIKFKNENKI